MLSCFCSYLPLFFVLADGPARGASAPLPLAGATLSYPRHSRSAAAVDHKERRGPGAARAQGVRGSETPRGNNWKSPGLSMNNCSIKEIN